MKATAFSKERTAELVNKFRRRLDFTPFTMEGVPHADEVNLTNDLWSALTGEEKGKILDNTRNMVAEKLKRRPEDVPEQTPYAKRLLFRYLQMEAKND
ncbi:MAG: hypothetical protein V1744_01435 [Candidatus Altiarchaeota archaeon]